MKMILIVSISFVLGLMVDAFLVIRDKLSDKTGQKKTKQVLNSYEIEQNKTVTVLPVMGTLKRRSQN